MKRPSPPDLFAEVAQLAHHLHWPLDVLLDLEHADRRQFLEQVSAMAEEVGAP